MRARLMRVRSTRVRSTRARPLHGIALPDVRTGTALDLATFSGVLVAIRHHG